MKIRLVINTKRPWKSTEEFKYERYSMAVVGHSSFLFMSFPFRNCTSTTWRHLFLHTPEPTVLSIILPILAPVSRESWVREGHNSLCSLKWLCRKMSFIFCFGWGLQLTCINGWSGYRYNVWPHINAPSQRFLSCHYQFISGNAMIIEAFWRSTRLNKS